jgi:hypothetical protein
MRIVLQVEHGEAPTTSHMLHAGLRVKDGNSLPGTGTAAPNA